MIKYFDTIIYIIIFLHSIVIKILVKLIAIRPILFGEYKTV